MGKNKGFKIVVELGRQALDKTENAMEELECEVLGAGWRWGSAAWGSLSRCRDLGWVSSTEKRKREKEGKGREKRKYLVWVMVGEASRLFPLLSSYMYWPSPFCWKDGLVHELEAVFNVIGLLFLSLALSSALPPLHPSGRFPKPKSHHSSFCGFEHCPDCHPLHFLTRFEFPHCV